MPVARAWVDGGLDEPPRVVEVVLPDVVAAVQPPPAPRRFELGPGVDVAVAGLRLGRGDQRDDPIEPGVQRGGGAQRQVIGGGPHGLVEQAVLPGGAAVPGRHAVADDFEVAQGAVLLELVEDVGQGDGPPPGQARRPEGVVDGDARERRRRLRRADGRGRLVRRHGEDQEGHGQGENHGGGSRGSEGWRRRPGTGEGGAGRVTGPSSRRRRRATPRSCRTRRPTPGTGRPR